MRIRMEKTPPYLYNPEPLFLDRKDSPNVAEATASTSRLLALTQQHHFLLRRLHSLTGLVFGGYIVVHLLVNATLVQGGIGPHDVYQEQVDKIHACPSCGRPNGPSSFCPSSFTRYTASGSSRAGRPMWTNTPTAKNYFYLLQPISAIDPGPLHPLPCPGNEGPARRTPVVRSRSGPLFHARHINSNTLVTYLIYPMGILASCYHLANGFWTAAITWGLTVSSGPSGGGASYAGSSSPSR